MSEERYFEDWRVGEVFSFGRYEVTTAEIKEFAEQFDPQPFHLDEASAADSPYGGLIASGWHTGAIMMRMIADNALMVGGNIASPGFDDLQWRRPVRPGDVLSVRLEVVETRPSRRKPDRGTVVFSQEAVNQAGEVAMSCRSLVLYYRRGPASGAADIT